MRKIILAAVLAMAIAAMQGCAVKRGVGLVNNALVVRDDYGSFMAELSAGINVQNKFSDSAELSAGFYHEQQTGQVLASSEAGLGVYYKLYSGGTFTVSAGLKYFDYLTYNYNYIYYYERTNAGSTYDYTENIRADYFNANKLSVIFPDVEIKLPFLDNLRLIANLELVYLKWYYNGGYYTSAYEIKETGVTGNTSKAVVTTPVDSFSYISPGRVTGVNTGSGLLYLGSINLGVLYYF